MELKRVVVTGLGAVTPLGNDVPSTWENIIAGQSGAAPITEFDASLFKTQFACEVKDLDVSKFIDRRELRSMDKYCQYAVVAAAEAVKDSGIDLESADKSRIGVVMGAGIGGVNSFQHEIQDYEDAKENGPKFSPFFIIKTIVSMASGDISIKYGFRGPNYATSSACASASHAISDAFNMIRLGKADMMFTGGSEGAICECCVGGSTQCTHCQQGTTILSMPRVHSRRVVMALCWEKVPVCWFLKNWSMPKPVEQRYMLRLLALE